MHHASICMSLYFVMLLDSFSWFSLVRLVNRKSKVTDTAVGMVQELEKVFYAQVRKMTHINCNIVNRT